MTTEISACPFCNCVLPVLPAAPTVAKMPCPRCGEPVPASRWPTATALAVGEPPARSSPAMRAALGGGAPPGIRTTAFTVLAVMLTMAIIGLAYALWTTQLRQSRHPWMPVQNEPIAFRKPLELAGLGYVPKATQIVAGLQIAEWLDNPAGKKLLEEPRPAPVDWVLKQITRSTGLKVEQIDHVILASTGDLQLVMIVTTRQPYSLQKVADAVHPVRSSNYQDQPLYEFELKPAGRALLWCVEDRTMIFVLRPDAPTLEHLNGLSATPRTLDEVLPASLRTMMAERLPMHNLVWAAGWLDQAGLLTDLLPFVMGDKADAGWLKSIQAFTLGIAPEDGLTLIGNFQMRDAQAARKFKSRLDDIKIEGAKSQKAEATPINAQEQWVTWQVRGDAATLRDWLGGSRKK